MKDGPTVNRSSEDNTFLAEQAVGTRSLTCWGTVGWQGPGLHPMFPASRPPFFWGKQSYGTTPVPFSLPIVAHASRCRKRTERAQRLQAGGGTGIGAFGPRRSERVPHTTSQSTQSPLQTAIVGNFTSSRACGKASRRRSRRTPMAVVKDMPRNSDIFPGDGPSPQLARPWIVANRAQSSGIPVWVRPHLTCGR
jgi:hypothetical protein